MVHIRLILQSFAHERRLFLLWIASLCVAVSGLLIADIFRNSMTHTLVVQGQSLLTADLEVSARRILHEDEIQAVHNSTPQGARFTGMTEMFAMAAHGADSRLASLRFVEDDYPLRGDLNVESRGTTRTVTGKELREKPIAWVAPDLLTLFKVQEGDSLKIGEMQFAIEGILRQDPSQTFRFGSMAPRVFLHRRFLPETRLRQFGSTFSESLFAAFPNELPGIKRTIESRISDPAVQVSVPADLEQGSLRVLSRLTDYLGLTGLVTLCLGWIGVFYLGRRWLALESGSIGVLKAIGMSEREVLNLLLLKLFVILGLGILGGASIAWLAAATVFPFVKDSLPLGFQLTWSWQSTLLLILVGPVAGLLLLFPAMRMLSQERALPLIHGGVLSRARLSDAVFFSLTSAALFFALTLVQARSWRITFIFLGALVGTVIVVSLLGFLSIRAFAILQNARGSWLFHLALALWIRRSGVAVLLVLVSSMAGLLSQLIPNIEKSLQAELEEPSGPDKPALFMFDIQDEQIEPVKRLLGERGWEQAESAPLIRARILKLNGAGFERVQDSRFQTREEENDSRFRNRGVNLSMRPELTTHEKIVAGKPWSEISPSLDTAEVSVETGYAERLGFHLGDTLRFDVQGVEFDARIANLREVDWNTFQPNFFMIFKRGALDEAPKTWVMTVRPSPNATPAQMQSVISSAFSNITSINVKEGLENLSVLFRKLGSGLRLASGVCMALGLFVFLMILLFQLSSTRRDRAQLQLLGLNSREILALQLVTYGGLAVLGVTLGSVMSMLVAGGLARFAFHSHLVIDWWSMGRIYALALAIAGAGLLLLARGNSRSLSAASAEFAAD